MSSSTRSTKPGIAQYGRTLVVGGTGAEFRVHEYELGEDFDGQALHAGAFELYLQDGARCRLAQYQDWGSGGGLRRLHAARVASAATATATGCRRCWAAISCASTSSSRLPSRAATWPSAASSSASATSTSTSSPSTSTRPGPSGGDVHWRGAIAGESRASFEGLIKINPGAQQTHTYLQVHSMLLSPRARFDAIPSVLVSADDVSASHGGTVGELDEDLIFYMQSRGMDRPAAVKVIVEGFFEPLVTQIEDAGLEEVVRRRLAEKLAEARQDIETYAATR